MKKWERIIAFVIAVIIFCSASGFSTAGGALRTNSFGVEFSITSNDLTVVENTNIDLLNGATLQIDPKEESANYFLIIKSVTSNDPSFIWNGTDTTINSGLPDTTYTVTYAVTDADGNEAPDITATSTITVVAASAVQYKDDLDEDGAYLTSFRATLATDGTGPFDTAEGPGNDTGASNGIVRSFDIVTYDIEASFASYQPETYYINGRIHYEMTLPCTAKEAVFDTASMGWMEAGWTVTTDPDTRYQTLRCSRILAPSENALAAIPGSNSVNAAIQVLAMKNGETVQPTFKAWMDHNDTENTPCAEHDRREVLVSMAPPVTVSAALRLNVQLKQIADSRVDTAEKAYDFSIGNELAVGRDKGTVTGCITGYGLTLQLYNANNNGMKGMEFPEDPITVTLDLSNSFLPDGGSSVASPAGYAPLLWSYGRNLASNTGDDGRYTGGQGYAMGAAPYSASDASSFSNIPHNGDWSAEQRSDGKITLTLTGYDIDFTDFPIANSGNSNAEYYGVDIDPKTEYTKISIGCFSAAELYVLQPTYSSETGNRITHTSEYGSGTFSTTVTVGNLTAHSSTGQSPQGIGGGVTAPLDNTNQQNTIDDRQANTVYLARAGSFAPIIRYTIYNHGLSVAARDVNNETDYINNGKDVVAVGQKLGIQAGFNYISHNRSENIMHAVNTLVKFDARALEIQRNILRPSTNDSYGMEETFFYGTLPGGANWESDAQMNAAREGDLMWYRSISDIPAGHLCVAVLREMRGEATGNDAQQNPWFYIDLQVRRDFELADQVYQTTIATRLWTAKDIAVRLAEDSDYRVPSVVDSVNFAADYPKSTVNYYPNYIKSVYENGVYVSGHNTDYRLGDSLYVVPYVTKISKSVEQKNPDNTPKLIYDMDLSQRVADYVLSPRIEMQQGVQVTMTTTITITDTLPKGLTYIPNSAVMGGNYRQADEEGKQGFVVGGTPVEPQITSNPDGTSVLTWKIHNVPVKHGDLTQIHYSCEIGDLSNPSVDVVNNQHLENTVTIASTEDTRPFTEIHGNIAVEDIIIVKLKQVALFKVPLQRFFDVGENVAWMAGYDNNGNNPAGVLLLDTMPYNGDRWGSSFSGGYTIASFAIDTAALGTDPRNFTVYYTTDTSYRDKILEDIGENTVRTWSTLPVNEDGTVAWGEVVPVCWAVEGEIPVDHRLRITLEVKQDNQQQGDTLCNAFSDMHNNVIATGKVVSRYLAGLTWIDSDRDGIRQSGEKILPGVTATLHYKDDDSIVVNGKGQPCTMQTGADGRYRFDNLPAGDFYVKFTDGDTFLSLYHPSPTRVAGAEESNNSDYVPALTDIGRVEYGVIDGIHMPTKEEMSSSLYYILYLDGGFYQAADLTITKAVLGQTGTSAEEFSFRLKLSAPEDEELDTLKAILDGTEVAYTVNAEDNSLSIRFTLANGESYTLEDLLPNVRFVLSETSHDGYVVQITEIVDEAETVIVSGDTTGVLTLDRDRALVVYNNKTGALTVTKTVDGNAPIAGKEFRFTVTLSDTTITGTYGEMNFTNGVATFTLKNSESKTATGLPNGITYEVTEADYTSDGYVTTKTGDTGTIVGNSELTATFTNTRNTYGGLVVTKTVSGNAASRTKDFSFTVTLSDTTITGTYGEMNFENGVATFTLKNGESKTATDLPNGITYEVTEADYTADGYVTTKTGDTGTIVGNEEQTAAFTNTRNADGSLTVSKTLEGNDTDSSKEFTFTITLSDTTINGEYSGVTFTSGVATITLKGGESKTIEELPNGTEYVVAEADYSSEGYVTTAVGDEGTIDETAPKVAAFTNTRDTYGDLTVTKTVDGNAPIADAEFTFTVTLSDTSITGTYGEMIFENGVATFTLKNGESKTATGLPNGITYEVTEADYTNDGYVTTSDGATGTITGGETVTAAFTNTRNVTPQYGSLTVKKTVTGDLADKEQYFNFTITFDAEGSYSYTGSKSGTIKSGDTVQLKHGESITISGLPAGTTYSVTESENNGYWVDASGDKGTIAANETSTAEFTNTKSGSPQTGDNSNIWLWSALMILSVFGLTAVGMFGRKGRYSR